MKVMLRGLLLLSLGFPLWAVEPDLAPAATEADVCVTCETTATTPKIEPIKSEAACSKRNWVIDPKWQSIYGRMGVDVNSKDPIVLGAAAFSTCFFGLTTGGLESVKDLVMAIPSLAGFTWRGVQSGVSGVLNFDYRSWLSTFRPMSVVDSVGSAFTVTGDTIRSAYNTSSKTLFDSYQQSGVVGSLATIGHAMTVTPYQATKKYLQDIGTAVAREVGEEWANFKCLPPDAIAETMCHVAGYIASDIVVGGLLIKGLSQSDKLKKAIAAARARVERAPIAGTWLTRDFKLVDQARCDGVPDSAWKVDGRARLQNQDVDVVVAGGMVLARGISPSTRKMACFEVVGAMASQVLKRIAATEGMAHTAAASTAAGASDDFFTAANQTYARDATDFVSGVNSRNSMNLSERKAAKIAASLGDDAVALEHYGGLHRHLEEMRRTLQSMPAKSAEAVALQKTINASEQAIHLVNSQLLRGAQRLNVEALREAMAVAEATKDFTGVALMTRALHEVADAAKAAQKAKADDVIKFWESSLLQRRRHLDQADIDRAKACLFSSVSR